MRGSPWLLILLIPTISLFALVDLLLDPPSRLTLLRVAFTIVFVTVSLGAAAYLWADWFGMRRDLSETKEALSARQAEVERLRLRTEKLSHDLREQIDAQLTLWDLSPPEQEVALLLISGCGFREIARKIGRSDQTARHHAAEVYRKSGLGRPELAAFFLENLFVPAPDSGAEMPVAPPPATIRTPPEVE
jgi:DNA-binding CsgD family transcriptional regulator